MIATMPTTPAPSVWTKTSAASPRRLCSSGNSSGRVMRTGYNLRMRSPRHPRQLARGGQLPLSRRVGDALHLTVEDAAGQCRKADLGGVPDLDVLERLPDDTVRICGDYKVTINPALDVPEYPLPTAQELFTQLNGGQSFSKLDLSSAYQQVLLDEESRQYVMINTHLGLFRYTRLPFGVAASPAIFQQTMDSILSGLNGVGGILDDLIVTGPNDKEHLCNLENTLKHLHSMGMKLKKPKCMFMKPSVEYFTFVVD